MTTPEREGEGLRFWQAVVIGQLAAGSVWADRHTGFPAHILAELGSVAIGAIMWIGFRALFAHHLNQGKE